MSSLVPIEIRGRFFGLRNSILGTTTIFVTIGGGLYLDWYKATFDSALIMAFVILFCVALGSSMMSSFFLNKKSEPELHRPANFPVFTLFKQAWQNINFRRMLRFGLFWAFAVNFATPFFVVYQLKELHFSYTLISIVTIISAMADLFGMGFWGNLSDSHGNRPVMLICAAAGSIMPILWILTGESSFSIFLLIPLLHLAGGFIFSGYTLSSVNMIFGIAPRQNNSVYFAMWNSANGLATALGAVCGGLFYDHGSTLLNYLLVDMEWSFKFIFLLSGVMRLSALFFMRRVEEPSTPVFKMVRILRNMRTWATTMGFHPLLQFFIPVNETEKSSPYWPIWKKYS